MEEIFIGQIIELKENNTVSLQLLGKETLVISKKHLGNFKIGDFMVCGITKEKKQKFTVRKLHIFKETQIGEITFENGKPWIKFTYSKEQKVKIPCPSFPNLYDGAKVRFKLENQNNDIKVIIYKILGHKENSNLDILELAERSEIPTVFSKHAKKQASLLKEPEIIPLNRKDLTKETIFTIDGEYSKDFDDAISLREENGMYILSVHIADVSHYIPEGSPLDIEAKKRGMTAYLLSSVFPMFPEIISNGVCSLNENVNRYTLSCEMKISKEGNIVDTHVFPSIICSKKRMTYECANMVLQGKKVDGYKPFMETLYEMSSLAEKLHQRRIINGAIDFGSSDPVIQLDQYGHVLHIEARNKGKSEQLIQEFMLAANQNIALLLKNKDLTFPYRIHGTPDMNKLKEVEHKLSSIGVSIHPIFEVSDQNRSIVCNQILNEYRESSYYPIISNLLISCMRRAKYSTQNIGHFGLALPQNVHFTSPIRRYPDLMIHRIIKKNYLDGKIQTPEEMIELSRVSAACTSCEKKINQCEEKLIRQKSREFLNLHIGETMDAIIHDCNQKGILIQLKDCLEQFIPKEELIDGTYKDENCSYTFSNSSIIYQLGTHLKVKLIKDPIVEGNIKFEIISPNHTKIYTLGNYNNFY